MIGRRRDHATEYRVVHQVASWCLDYPDESLAQRLPLLGRALTEQPQSTAVTLLATLVEHLTGRDLGDLQRDYVEVFDLSRDRALHLSYWTDGDTRRRGEVLARFKAAYRDSGFVVDLRGELPDHLPTVLEFAAIADPAAGTALLQEYRPSLELLRFALLDLGTPYAAGVAAVCATLPGESPPDRATVHAQVAPPPVEQVGLELQPYGDRP
ncbi:nitrate reductase molybdenum cofactor assembly chaperone [Jiangella anatolica]|uniref:Nitrate reductase molybdenum cofactor assembly chaperone n=1 Tax=Jiangella anatolica TaxID=2670374 RepID=A0A2W2BUM7_9ACTN|nr:nitrate reductase molybdenum cofactor assembly chaperone [Jiangella anatolica]PZF79367.1 nitrate reductase molybdenum cofactor assembly chaperone [Jiangella anatolica]